MIHLTTEHGSEYVAAENIARITEASASSQWHGIRSFVRTFDGKTIECQQTAAELAKAVELAAAKGESK